MVKKIHYCWFGGNPLPESAKDCIKSWKKYLPDYEIIEWNEKNFDIGCCRYVKEAYEAKKWAFVSDYARFKILMEHGGIYFDTDVEVIKNFESIVNNGSFMGCEKTLVAPGLGIGYENNSETRKFYEEILDFYNGIVFVLPDGSYNQKTIVEYTTELLKQHGYQESGEKQKICEITIYPQEYFCPYDPEKNILNITENTVSIHKYDSSWFGERELFIKKIRDKMRGKIGITLASYIAVFIGTVKYDGMGAVVNRLTKRTK